MDLYIKVGTIVVLLIGFLGLIYTLAAPVEPMIDKVDENNAVLKSKTEQSMMAYLDKFNAKVDVRGEEVWELIDMAKDKELAILVGTIPQQGLVVNYGYQLRGANHQSIFLDRFSSQDTLATEFEKMFVTTVRQVFTPGIPSAIQPTQIPRTEAGLDLTSGDSSFITHTMSRNNPSYHPGRTGNLEVDEGTPHVYFADPRDSSMSSHAKATGFTYDGYLVTDQQLKFNAPFNDNVTYAKTSTSYYYISPNDDYLTAIIKSTTGDIVGVYVEQKGMPSSANPLARFFDEAGIIP